MWRIAAILTITMWAGILPAQAQPAAEKLGTAEQLLAAGKATEALAITTEILQQAPEDLVAAELHIRVAYQLKNYRAVEHYAFPAIESALKAGDETTAVKFAETFSASFVDAMQVDHGVQLLQKKQSWKLLARVADAWPQNVRAAVAYVRLLRGFRGWYGQRWSEIRRVGPCGIRAAHAQERWAETLELAKEYGYVINLKGGYKPAAEEYAAIKAANPIALFDLAIDAGRRLQARGETVHHLGTVVGHKITYQAQELGGKDYAAAIRTFREQEAYAKERVYQHYPRARTDQAYFLRVCRGWSDLLAPADALGEELIETEYRDLALWAMDTYGARKQAELDMAARLLAAGDRDANGAMKDHVLNIYRRYGVTPPDGADPAQALAVARKDKENARGTLRWAEEELARLSTDRAKLMAMQDDTRKVADQYITAAIRCGEEREAFETAERLQARALRDMLAQRAAVPVTADHVGAGAAATESAPLAPGATGQRDLALQGTLGAGASGATSLHEQEWMSRVNAPPATIAQIQQYLDADTTLVFLHVSSVVSIPQSWGFVALVSRNDFHLVPQKDLLTYYFNLEKSCASFRRLLQAGAQRDWTSDERDRFKALAQLLYKNTLAPVRERLKTPRLVIVPSRELYELPIGLFVDEQGRYLIESYAISYAPSATVLKHCLARPPKPLERVFVAANPALPDPSHALKYAEQEATAIQGAYPGAELCMGTLATESAVRAALVSCDVLHLACHGIASAQEPMDSFLALAADNACDGRLTSLELLGLRTSAQLVVLSACDTGRGAINIGAQELLGMVRGWLLAGAPSVIASLWKLDDRSTSELMAEFYKNLKTMGRAEALQKAQMEMMKKYENPYYWGAFVLYGDYR